MNILKRHIADVDTIRLIEKVVESFSNTKSGKGLPLGNLTSQLLVNVYMNEFDQYVKHTLKIKYYIRYADDFVVLSHDREYVENILEKMKCYLETVLCLSLHPNKVFIKTVSSGLDFLGWVHFPDHRVLRTSTKRRMLRNIKEKNGKKETVQSYLGLLKHGNTMKLRDKIKPFIG